MRRTLSLLGTALAGILLPLLAYAQPANPSMIQTCILPLSCNHGDLASYLYDTVIVAAFASFNGVLFGALIYYGLKLLFTPENDSSLTETKQALEYAILGTVLVLGVDMISSAFYVGGIHPSNVNPLIQNIIAFVTALVGSALLANIVIQGIMMITAGDEGGVTRARTLLIHSCIGAGIVVLAAPIIGMLVGGQASADELIGIGNFLITLFGALAVIGLIVSGILLVISTDESFKDRAKKLAISCIVALIVVLAAAGIINLFLL